MKKRTMNELRQEKEYQNCTGDVKTGTSTTVKNHFEYSTADKLVDKIADKISSDVFDMVFQAVNDEMGKYYTFQDTNYLTEAGLELFEDEWFEFYHEYHGKIMYQVLQNLK